VERSYKPSFKFEIEEGFPTLPVAGVDEVGRGCLAGPVYCAAALFPEAVIAKKPRWLRKVTDSKMLTPEVRKEMSEILKRELISYSIVSVSESIILEKNILHASMWGMEEAIRLSHIQSHRVLVDGNRVPPGLIGRGRAIIKGDLRSYSIAAASILAKVARDEWMEKLHETYPQYGWIRNKGYPTPDHKEALLRHGSTPIHRQGFQGVPEPTLDFRKREEVRDLDLTASQETVSELEAEI
jgi:ribonuclease HII